MKYVNSFSLCETGGYHYFAPDYINKYRDKTSLLIKIQFINEIIKCKKDVLGTYNHPLIKQDLNKYANYICLIGTMKKYNSSFLCDQIVGFRKCMKTLKNTQGILLKSKLLYWNPTLLLFLLKIKRKIMGLKL